MWIVVKVVCFGKNSSDSLVCTGHGSCTLPDECICQNGWTNRECQEPICFGHNAGATNVSICSGHGSCTDFNTCSCDSGYTGIDCSIPVCYLVIGSNSSVCSGHGICADKDTCNCDVGWTGSDCSEPTEESSTANTCGWLPQGTLYAPTPIILSSYNSENIVFDITMRNNPENPVEHYISLKRIESINQFVSSSTVSVISASLCDTQYRVTVPWNSNELQKTLQDQTLKINANVWMYYVLDSSTYDKFIEFSKNKVFYVQLESTSFVTIVIEGSQEIAHIEAKRIYNDGYGRIRIEAVLTVIVANMELESVTFISSSSGTILTISTAKLSTYVYNVTFTASDHTNALIGSFVVSVSVSNGTVTLSNRLQFETHFESIDTTPPINITMDTVTTVRRSLNGSQQTVFGYGQTPFVFTALKATAPQLSDGQQLQVLDAYLCCMSNNGAMPIYNPIAGNIGCTIYDPETMDYWTQLIQSGSPSQPSTQVYTPNTRSAVFSFSIDSLTNERRTCYIHISSSVKNVANRRSIDDQEDTVMINSAALSIQMMESGGGSSGDTIVVTTSASSVVTPTFALLLLLLVTLIYLL